MEEVPGGRKQFFFLFVNVFMHFEHPNADALTFPQHRTGMLVL